MDAIQRTLVYSALGSLSERWLGVRDAPGGSVSAANLTPFELKVFSQNGEDGVIAEIFRRIGVGPRRFVEFGAEDGREANSIFLCDVLGWEGLFIESDDSAFTTLAGRFRDNPRVTTVHASVSPSNIDQLLTDAGFSGDIDLLSIDIDGHDYWVWQSISSSAPRLVVVEYNAHIPYPERLVQPLEDTTPWQGTDFFGASLGALEHLGAQLGYSLVHTDLAGVNAFFVRDDLLEDLPVGDLVPRRAPNYFLTGTGHPHDQSARRMVDPVTGL